MKRVLAAAAVAVGIMVASPASAGAFMTYCDWDPLVVIVTPDGNIVPVYDSVWTSSPLSLGVPLESYTTERVYDKKGNPQTAVDMTIYVPTGLLFNFATTDEVTTGLLGSGTVLARASGNSGQAVHLKFTLSQP